MSMRRRDQNILSREPSQNVSRRPAAVWSMSKIEVTSGGAVGLAVQAEIAPKQNFLSFDENS